MQKTWRILKKVGLWLSLIFLFLIAIITIFLNVYEDDIEQYAVTEINKYLDVKVDVQDIDLTFFSNFPYVSLDFQKVLILDNYETIKSEDTLFYAKNLYLNFNLIDIYKGDYKVKRINTKQAVLKIKTAENGEVNYNIVKPSEDSTQSKFDFEVKQFKLSDFRFQYTNVATRQFYGIDINKGKISGNFSETEYNLKAESGLHINQLKTNSFTLISDKNAELDLEMSINTGSGEYHFTKGDLKIEQMPFHITGLITNKFIDLSITGNQIQLDELSHTILNNSIEIAQKYDSKGEVSFDCSIKGAIEKTSMPAIDASFSIVGGTIKEIEKNLAITDLNVKGIYRNQQGKLKEQLKFSEISMNLLGSHFNGNTEVTDFALPTFKGNLSGQLNLKSFHEFLTLPSVEILTGNIVFNTNYAIQFSDIQYNPGLFNIFNTTGNFKLSDLTYKGVGDNVTYQNINGDIIVNGDDAAAKNISIHTQNSDLLINGALKNFIPFIEGTGQLGLIATLESDYILLDDFLGDNSQNANNTTQQTMFEIPDIINLNLELHVNKFDWDNHQFKQISGKLLMANRVVTIRHFNLKTLQGDIAGNLKISNFLEKGNTVDGKLRFNGINVKSLFKEWDNFDQTSITSQNINGSAKGQIDLLLKFDQYFNIETQKMLVSTNLSIVNGALDNLATMKDITGYMRTNKGLKLALNKHIDDFEAKLMHIQFKELQNNIIIKNGKINIPKMNIYSSAMDLTLSGWHDFNNEIDYHFSFRFRELKTIPEYTEFGKVEDDGLGWRIYLSMYGPLDDPNYKLDKDERKATRKENIAEEKATFKSIMKTEIGLYAKDTSVKVMEKEQQDAIEFIMYDEGEEPDLVPPSNEKRKRVTPNKKQTNKFFEKLKQAELQEAEKETIEIEQ